MSYNITLTNGNLLAVIPDGTFNANVSPPLVLIGRNYAGGYGEFQNDNYVRLLESGANSTAPATPLVGQLWYNTTSKSLQVYNGISFKSISGATASATAPTTNNTTGDLWYDTVNEQLNVWSGTTWIIIGPPASTGTGAVPAILLDAGNVEYSVVELTVDGNIVGIVSQSAPFSPYPTLSGFGNVYPGITLSSLVNSQTPSLVGTATNATTLTGLGASAFMRTDQNTQTTGRLVVLNNLGIAIGNSTELTANIVSGTVNLYNNSLNNNFNIGINKGGTKTAAIQINGATSDVTITGNLTVSGTTTTVNTEIINTDEIITGNLSAGKITSNTTVTGTLVGNGANISNITGANVTGTVSYAANATNATYSTILKTSTWTVTETAGKLVFQVAGNTIASLDSSGNFTTIGNVTAFGTP